MEIKAREGTSESRCSSASKREKRFQSRRAAHISFISTTLAVIVLMASGWKRHSNRLRTFSSTQSTINENSGHPKIDMFPGTPGYPRQDPVPPAIPPSSFQRRLDLSGVQEHLTTIRQDWRLVINNFMDDSDIGGFSARKIKEHFYTDVNNVQDTCVLVMIKNNNVTFIEKFKGNRHSRATSVRYILEKIVKEKGKTLAGATFMVMLSDGHRPLVPTFGSARHWKPWKAMIPVPLGNSRGGDLAWGTPLQGWDTYIDRTIVSSHANYSWHSKYEKAVFRGSLSMQTYKLGSCNEENGGHCVRANRWNEINRGVLYEKSKIEPDLFDVGFTLRKRKIDGPADQLKDAPPIAAPVRFQDFQKYKYIINVGNNQDWAERLRSLLYMNSVIIIHQAETQEFFTPLLKPWVHFIPTNLYMDDLISNIKWARENDQYAQQIVRNQNAFADRYITERSMQQYWEVALEEFSIRQAKAAGVEPRSNK